MANLLDYVRWRGDLTFDERPFNPVDNLVLSALSYVDLAELMPAGASITIADAATRLNSAPVARSRRLTVVNADLLTELGHSPRSGQRACPTSSTPSTRGPARSSPR